MATAYVGPPGQRAMLDWMAEQSKYRGFAQGMPNRLRHYDFPWRPEAFQALGHSGIPVFAAWGTDDTVHPTIGPSCCSDTCPRQSFCPSTAPGMPLPTAAPMPTSTATAAACGTARDDRDNEARDIG